MKRECRGYRYYVTLLSIFLVAVFSLSACSNPEKAKAEHLSRGEAYLKESKFQEASLEFRNAIQIDERLAAAHWGLARAYEGLQRIQDMVDELRKTADLDPNNLEARLKLGNIYIAGSGGRPEIIKEAEKLADEIIAKDPNNIEGHILRGSVYFAQSTKNNDSNLRLKALESLNHAISLDPKRAESYLALAKYYVVTRDNEKAEQTFKKAIEVNYNLPMAHSEYGKFLVQQNRNADAEVELRRAVEVAPEDRPSRFVLASFYLINKQLDKAEEAYKALAALDKDRPEGMAVLGDFYSATNRLDEAIRIYQGIVTKSPDYLQARYRLAEIMLMRGDTQGAGAQIEEVLKKDAHDRQALLIRARLRSIGNQQDGLKAALEDLKDVLNQEPNSRAGLYYMAQTHFSLGLIDQARSYASDLEKNYPDYLPAKLMQAQLSIASGDTKNGLTQATDLIERLNKISPDRESSPQLLAELRQRAYQTRGTANLSLGNVAAAKTDFEAARDQSPNDPNPYNNLALVAISEKKDADAEAYFEQALKVDATNFMALNGLITLYYRSQQLDKAHAKIDQALASYPNNANLHFLKAQIYGYQRDVANAEAELQKVLAIDSNYLGAYSSLGALYINTKQEDRAIGEFKKIIEKRPDNATAYTMIGMLEDARKNYDVAEQNYRKALEKDPNAIIAANNLAWLYAVTGKGNLDEAVRLAQGVVQKNPNIAGFVDTLGWVYFKKNLNAAAIEQLQKAVNLDEAAAKARNLPPSGNYHYHLGMALLTKGDKAAAKRELEAAVRLAEKAPFAELEEAKKALATL